MKKKSFIFSRIHKKKGLDILLKAWKKIKLLNWELYIYGPDYDKYINQLDPTLKKIDGVIFKGPLFDVTRKEKFFRIAI